MLEMNPSNKNDSSDNKKKTKWLAALVLLLILLLVGQTGAVIYYLNRRDKTVPAAASEGAGYPSYAPPTLSRQSASPASAARRRHARNAYQTHDPLVDDTFDSMNRLEDHLNRMVSHWVASAPSMNDLFGGSDAFDFMPKMDLEEKSKEYIIKADLPGLDKNQIDISVKGDLLTLKGVRKSESKTADDQSGIFKQERSYGSFARSLRLPGPVEDTKISADYQNGVLTIHLPKVAGTSNSKKIEIQ